MRIGEFQRHIGELYLEKDKRRGREGTLLWLIEEVGEMTEAARRSRRASERSEEGDARSATPVLDGRTRPQTRPNELDHLGEEMADVLAWTASLANLYGVDLEAAVSAKYPAACKRCGAKPCACPEPAAAPL